MSSEKIKLAILDMNNQVPNQGLRCIKDIAAEFLPKMERCNARTMEIFRRMGLAEKVRAAMALEEAYQAEQKAEMQRSEAYLAAQRALITSMIRSNKPTSASWRN